MTIGLVSFKFLKPSASARISLSSAEWSSCLEEICNISCLVFRVKLEIVFHTLLTLGLDIEILEVIPADGLSFILIKSAILFVNKLMESVLGIIQAVLMSLRVHDSQHLVVS